MEEHRTLATLCAASDGGEGVSPQGRTGLKDTIMSTVVVKRRHVSINGHRAKSHCTIETCLIFVSPILSSFANVSES